jgi:glycine betaine/proline transport system permease protein
MFLKWFQDLLVATPWPIILFVIGALSWIGSRSWKMSLGAF